MPAAICASVNHLLRKHRRQVLCGEQRPVWASSQPPRGWRRASDSTSPGKTAPSGINGVQNVVVIYMENHSFDDEYGYFPGANGLSQATSAQETQIDSQGVAYTTLNQVAGSPFPLTIPNGPFDMTQYVPLTDIPPDLVHRYYQEIYQIDGGKMDKFANIGNVKGESMANYPTAQLPLATIASTFTLCDNFFHSAFGGSMLNHQWLISAQTPVFNSTPDERHRSSQFERVAGQRRVHRRRWAPYYVINTSYSVNHPQPSGVAPAGLIPNLTDTTIGDRLTAANVSWTWFSGGWDNALAGNPDSLFQFHHQPFIYYANYADGTPAKACISRTRPISSPKPIRARCRLSRSSSRWARTTSTPATPMC